MISSENEFKNTLTPSVNLGIEKSIYTGTGVHPGCVSGFFFSSLKEARKFHEFSKKQGTEVKIIIGIDEGNCSDLESLTFSSGVISTNNSPNAWCAVQAKSEGLPTVIGLPGIFNDNYMSSQSRSLSLVSGGNYDFIAHDYYFDEDLSIVIQEGDLITIDGSTGAIYMGEQELVVPIHLKVYRLLTELIYYSIKLHGPIKGWEEFHSTTQYAKSNEQLVKLIGSEEFIQYNESILKAASGAPIKVYSTAHTEKGIIYSRLQTALIQLVSGVVIISLSNELSGVGLLRTERYFRKKEELNSLRACILGKAVLTNEAHAEALKDLEDFEYRTLTDLLMTNANAMTVIRTLCMPLNKLFYNGLDVCGMLHQYPSPKSTIEVAKTIEDRFKETDTFHGMRGARLHTIDHELTKSQIRAILKSTSRLSEVADNVDVTILISMVTLCEEVELYIKLYDDTFDELTEQGWKLPQLKLAIMVETSAAYICLEDFIKLKGKHIKLEGTLFGGNDFTSATLNMSRSDAEKNIVPSYLSRGFFESNPFLSLNKIVLRAIGNGQKVIKDNALYPFRNGFGGEQAGDWDTVERLTNEAVPFGLDYTSTSPDRITEAIFSSYSAKRNNLTEKNIDPVKGLAL
ncbi:hypothetical protein A9Q81_06415 [Gammaproteobacteria bacterium 42_54_T18]|nr:hypothetical protein A9Q81_06415 [Gammaproteobacteria bacterium 42_54_T18]